MKSLFSKYTWLQLILSILLLFGGSLIIIFAAMGKMEILEDGLNIIAAVILFLFGLFAIVASFAFEGDKIISNGIIYGSASIAMGVFLLIKEFLLLDYLVYLLAIFFIVVGAIELIKAIILVIKKSDKTLAIVFAFIFAVIFINGGILAIIFKENVRIAFCIIAGVIIFLVGAYLMFTGIKEMIVQAKNKKRPAKVKKDKQAKEEEKPFDETVEYEAPQELNYTAEVPALEEKKEEEPKQEVIDAPEQPQEQLYILLRNKKNPLNVSEQISNKWVFSFLRCWCFSSDFNKNRDKEE